MEFLVTLSCLDKKAYWMEVRLTETIARRSWSTGRGELAGFPAPWNVLGKQAFDYDVFDSALTFEHETFPIKSSLTFTYSGDHASKCFDTDAAHGS